MRRIASGPWFVFAAATLWGTTGTAQALGPDGITPETVAALRMAGGALLLLVAAGRGRTTRWESFAGPEFAWAVVAMAASQPLFFTGVERTGVAVGTIVTIGSGPIIAGLLGWVVRGERPGRRWMVATSAAIGGAVLLASGGEAAGIDTGGLLFALGAGVGWATYLVAAKGLFERNPPVFMAGAVFAGATVLLSPFLVFGDPSWVLTTRGALVALWLGVAVSAGSYILFSLGLGSTSVAAAATLSLAEPLTAAILGIAVLDEPMRWSSLVGIALIAFGLVLIARRRERMAA